MYTINFQTPQFLTNNEGDSFALIPAEEYRELLSLVEMYEEMEDIRAAKEVREHPSETEPIDVFFERVEKYRKEKEVYRSK